MESNFYQFKSGLRLVTNKVEENRPASLYIRVGVGSSAESEKREWGIAHLIEHMMFKGTKKRSAKDINDDFDRIGARSNASTDDYVTNYYAIVLNEKLEDAFEILSDMFFNSTFNEKELEKEKKVVYEEIDGNLDDTTTVLFDRFNEIIHAGSTLSHRVLGTKENLKELKREDLVKFYKKFYTSNNIILSVSSSFSDEKIKDLVEKFFESHFDKSLPVLDKTTSIVEVPNRTFEFIEKDTNQSKIILGFPADNVFRGNKYEYSVMSFVLSNRLFNKIREENGLVYSISAFYFTHERGGEFDILLSPSAENAKDAMKLVKIELDTLKQEGITLEELESAKISAKMSVAVNFEKGFTVSKINAQNLGIYNKLVSSQEMIEEINKVTTEDVLKLAGRIIDYTNICILALGKNLDRTIFEGYE